MTAEIRIGTSGWHYGHWLGPFYPADLPTAQMLTHYLRYFDTVEINNSFYRLPELTTFENWREATPENFCFAVKASRYLTHMKKLKDPERGLENLMPRVAGLGEKLGPILFQLPPHWHVNVERLQAFLAALPLTHRYSFELRDTTWHTPEVYEVLRQHNVAFCIYDLAGFQSALEITADFAYIRLHGPGGAYQGSYSEEALQEWARLIRQWSETLKAIYVYFDNDQAAYAVYNALRLKELCLVT
ncbi:MAG: DUF72 domain-containing protein [Abitibacteriaceae bacterium]|nr:DUF72 domain-containing protein [Abditibacteriaceae bacterium]MBV9867693.1 DUF72 domain-containing protein [Abditibacteriaceae bacterium]